MIDVRQDIINLFPNGKIIVQNNYGYDVEVPLYLAESIEARTQPSPNIILYNHPEQEVVTITGDKYKNKAIIEAKIRMVERSDLTPASFLNAVLSELETTIETNAKNISNANFIQILNSNPLKEEKINGYAVYGISVFIEVKGKID